MKNENEKKLNNDFIYISSRDMCDDISLSINQFINNGCVGGVAYGIAIKEGIQRNVIEMIDNKRMIIDDELSFSDLCNVLNKYHEDRFNVVNNGSYEMVELIPGDICSCKYQLINGKLKIYLSRKPSNNEFDDCELYFIKRLVDILFEGEIIVHRSRLDDNMMGFYLTSESNDMCIKLTNMANYNMLFIALVNNHNIEVKNNINRKLKKEGEN